MNRRSLLKSILILFLVLFVATTSFAQNDEEEEGNTPELSLFRGGNLALNLKLGVNMNGVGLGSSMMGGIISPRMKNGAGALTQNPAELGIIRRAVFTIDGLPPIGTWSGGSLNNTLKSDVNSELESSISDVVNDETQFLQTPDAYIRYTQLSELNAGFARRLAGVSVAIPVHKRLVFAASSSRPLDIGLQTNLSGISAKIAQEQGTEDVALRFDVLMNIGLLADVRLQTQQLNVGFGSNIYDSKRSTLSVGFTATNYQINHFRYLNTDLSGMVVIGGADERFFNNPLDVNLSTDNGESNAFFLRSTASYTTSQWGYRAGILFERQGRSSFSIVYNQMPDFNLRARNASSEAALPIFLVGDDIFESLEVVLDTLEASKPNLTTVRDISGLTDDILFSMPSSLTFATDLAMGRHTLTLNYSHYLTNFEMRLGDDIYGKENPFAIGFGLDFAGTDRFLTKHQWYIFPLRLLFLDFDGILFQTFRKFTGYSNPHYRFGGKALFGTGYTQGSVNQNLQQVFDMPILPLTFSMGREYTVFENFRIGVTGIAVPDFFFRMSVAYTF